jgi:hypothetical protein
MHVIFRDVYLFFEALVISGSGCIFFSGASIFHSSFFVIAPKRLRRFLEHRFHWKSIGKHWKALESSKQQSAAVSSTHTKLY